jgi:hypothetical protein
MIGRRELGVALMGMAGTSITRTDLSTGQNSRTNTLMHVGGDYHNIVGGDIAGHTVLRRDLSGSHAQSLG